MHCVRDQRLGGINRKTTVDQYSTSHKGLRNASTSKLHAQRIQTKQRNKPFVHFTSHKGLCNRTDIPYVTSLKREAPTQNKTEETNTYLRFTSRKGQRKLVGTLNVAQAVDPNVKSTGKTKTLRFTSHKRLT